MRSAVQPLADRVDEELVSIYVATLWPRGATGVPSITPDTVQRLVEELNYADPVDRAITTLEDELGISARRHGVLIEIKSELAGDPRRPLIHAVSLARGADAVGAYGRAGNTDALVIWQPPTLVVLRRGATAYGGRYHSFSPEDLISSPGELPGRREELRQPVGYSDTTRRALTAVGLNPDDPFGDLP